jgi:opacity protein-like surface antigen
MSSVRILALAGAAAAAMSTAAFAADFPPTLPPAQPAYQPAASESGWYLRGDVGVGVQRFQAFDHFQTNSTFVWPASWQIVQKETDDSAFIDVGVGYQMNNWLRFDFTAEHRAMAKFKVVGSYGGAFCNAGVGTCFDQYDGSHSAEVFMANAYLDLGTWWCLTPFVGVGVGGAWNTVSSLSDVGLVADGTTGFGFAASDNSSWNLAWSATAGLTYNVSNNLKLEFAARYLNLGSVKTAVVNCSSVGCSSPPNTGPSAYYTLTNFDSLDFKLGMRWMFQPETPVYAPPLIRKG